MRRCGTSSTTTTRRFAACDSGSLPVHPRPPHPHESPRARPARYRPSHALPITAPRDPTGQPLDTVTYTELAALAGNTEAAEAEDLDYKETRSAGCHRRTEGRTGQGRRGLRQSRGRSTRDRYGRGRRSAPSKVMDTDISDAHLRHLHQVIARHTAPVVRFAMRPVPNPATPGRGILLIAVPRGPLAPHA